MSYKIEKECKPCIVCNYTGWELITDCRCEECNDFQNKNMQSLIKYWKEYHGKNVKLKITVEKVK